MNKKSKKIVSVLLMMILVIAMAVPTFAAPKISKKSVTMIKGQSVTIKVTGYKGKVKWSSSKSSVATVKNGKITAKKAGTAKITATAGKKKLSCTVKVEDPKLSAKSLKLNEGESATLKLNGTKQKVTWSSSNLAVATVAGGKVDAVSAGSAVITAKVAGKSYKCNVTVVAVPKFTKDDYSVEYGTQETYVEFKYNKNEVTKEELEEAGYTVNGDIASKTEVVNTAQYTFRKLPTNLEELKLIDFDTMFGPMAATICAITTWENKPAYEGMYNHPIYDMFEYCQRGLKIENIDRSSMYTVMQGSLNVTKYAFFEGATPSNNYTPNYPYTFKLVEGPYILKEKISITGEKIPERHMVLISFAGDDAQRYCDIFQSKTDGKWYCWKKQWQHLVASYKPVVEDYAPYVEPDVTFDVVDSVLTSDDEVVEFTDGEILVDLGDEIVADDSEIIFELHDAE